MKFKNFILFLIFNTTQFNQSYCMFDFLFEDPKKIEEETIQEDIINETNSLENFDSDDSDSDSESLSSELDNSGFSFNKANKANFDQLNEIYQGRKVFENSLYKSPEKRLDLLKQILFDKKITKYDERLNSHAYNLSLKEAKFLATIVIKVSYILKEGGFDFDLDYIKLLELLFENVIDNRFNFPVLLRIINNMPALEEILKIRLEKLSPEQISSYEKIHKVMDIVVPLGYRLAFVKLFTQISCMNLTDSFKFEDRENLLKALARKLLAGSHDYHFTILSILIKDKILEVPCKTNNQITLTGIDLNLIKSSRKINKIEGKIKSRLEHSLRIIDEIQFEIEETKSDEEYDSSGYDTDSDVDSE